MDLRFFFCIPKINTLSPTYSYLHHSIYLDLNHLKILILSFKTLSQLNIYLLYYFLSYCVQTPNFTMKLLSS